MQAVGVRDSNTGKAKVTGLEEVMVGLSTQMVQLPRRVARSSNRKTEQVIYFLSIELMLDYILLSLLFPEDKE